MKEQNYPKRSRPVEKCFASRIKQHSNKEDQCVKELHAEESKGGNSDEKGHTGTDKFS